VTETVRAAGGVVWRNRADGETEVVLVHRPRYDDWTLPKGKAHDGETDEACALREVAEETGLTCTLGPELEPSRYVDGRGRRKTVRYWRMEPLGGELAPLAEVDRADWLELVAAARQLSYDRDRRVLASFAPRASQP